MAEWLPKADAVDMDALVALAELPLQIRGYGPVKMDNATKAEKRREELLAALRQGPQDMVHAAE